MATDPVPAITEAEATGETAEIYADIKASLGIGVVNLIWRHLATIDGALPWVWTAIKPLYVSGAAAREGAALFDELALPQMPRFPDEVLRLAGVADDDRATVTAVLDSYNRGNSLNLIAFSALTTGPSGELPSSSPATGGIETPIPALPGLDTMDPDLGALVMSLSDLGAKPEDRIVPSMYRHLSYWPGFLSLIWATVAPMHHDGRLERMMADAYAAGERHAGRLANQINPGTPPATAEEARAAIAEFRRSAISRMVPVAMMIRRMMD